MERCRIGIDSGDYERLRSLVASADLIIDASASHPLNAFLSDLCWELNRPYVWLTTTPGGKSGVVGRVISNEHTCWRCYLRAMADGRVHTPAIADRREIQPGGCAQPTFIGAGLDSDEIALLASRLSIATLSRGMTGGYPDFDWNVAVGELFSGEMSTVPQWRTCQVAHHPQCHTCRAP